MTGEAAGLIVAAPASGSGKTVITLGVLRQWMRRGLRVASAKVGPDYIDPAFHAAASGRPCRNLDPWAMRPATLAGAVGQLAKDADLVLAEGVMGLFDGALVPPAEGRLADGSTAHLAELSGWPVVLVVDARAQAASAAAVVRGFATHRGGVRVAGVIFNRVGGEGHARILRQSMEAMWPPIPVLGCLPRIEGLELPARHLGLVQASEHPDLGAFLDGAADWVGAHLDLARLGDLARPWQGGEGVPPLPLPPLGQRIAIADDEAFAFRYGLVLDGWKAAGAELSFFSPLSDQAPAEDADAVYLPGGYPELFAARLAGNDRFLNGLRGAARRGAVLFGECGGYMVLGRGLTDAQGRTHAMAGLLPLATSFAQRRLHLGYREARLLDSGPLGPAGARFRGHEFHYATVLSEVGAAPLFAVSDAAGQNQGVMGLRAGSVAGSFVHLIDRRAE